MPHHHHHFRRIVILVIVLVAVFLVARSDTIHHAVLDVLGEAEELMHEYPRSGMLLFVVLAAFSAMLTFFSSTALVPIGVYVWGPTTTMLLLLIGGVSGGTAGYWASHTWGRRLVKRIFPSARFRRYETFFRNSARWRTILLFRVALQSELPSYVLGLVRYPFKKYLPIMILGELPYVVLVVYLGEKLLERNSGVFAAVLILGLTLTALALWLLHREMTAAEKAKKKQV